jgi:hypothetical protein
MGMAMMRRPVAIVAVLALTGVACGGVDTAPGRCRLDPPSASGEITFVQGRRLMAIGSDGQDSHCLVSRPGTDGVLQWAPTGDRGLLGTTEMLGGASRTAGRFPGAREVAWSPTGRSLLAVSADGRLFKRPVDGGAPKEVTFLNRHDSALYHPGGRAIVSVGDGGNGYGIYLADATGKLLVALAAAETAHHLGPLAWRASGDLVFAAEHEDRWDLHELHLATGALQTLASTAGPADRIDTVVASPFPDSGVAWREADCTASRTAARVLSTGGTPLPAEVAAARPAAWLPDGPLILSQADRPCTAVHATDATTYSFKDGRATRVASVSGVPAVRVAVPPGPALPSTIPSDAPI